MFNMSHKLFISACLKLIQFISYVLNVMYPEGMQLNMFDLNAEDVGYIFTYNFPLLGM